LQKIEAVVETERTDIAAAIRLGTARRFRENGPEAPGADARRNENTGDALAAVLAAGRWG